MTDREAEHDVAADFTGMHRSIEKAKRNCAFWRRSGKALWIQIRKPANPEKQKKWV